MLPKSAIKLLNCHTYMYVIYLFGDFLKTIKLFSGYFFTFTKMF